MIPNTQEPSQGAGHMLTARADPRAQGLDFASQAMLLDTANYLPDDVLTKVDRASMLNSLEVRSPLLDQRMIEFAFGKVPSRLKATPTEKKILLKRLCTRLLPQEFDLQRKQGFSIPMNVWLKGGPFRTLFDDVLRDPQCSFDAQTVNKLMRARMVLSTTFHAGRDS